MNLLFTVVMLLMGYQLTVNRRNRKEIKNLRNQVSEFNQLLEMNLVYGKAETKKGKETEEAFKEEERFIDQQHTGEPTAKTPRKSVSDGSNV